MVLDRQRIKELASQYPDVAGRRHYNKEKELLRTLPQKFENGNWGTNTLDDILEWFRAALKGHFSENSSEDVQQALDQVRDTTDVQEKVEILDELYGVGVSVASAILLFTNPDEYAVMTRPSVEALRDESYSVPSTSDDFSSSDYVQYLDTCRTITNRENVTLRELDRALFVAADS